MIKKELEKYILGIINDTLGLNEERLTLDHPKDENWGDYSTSVALKVNSRLNQSPKEIATRIINSFYKSMKEKEIAVLVESLELVPPGFINLRLKTSKLLDEALRAVSEGERYGRQDGLKNKKIMIEFADPNPFKEFHIGHLRNISLGESLVRLHRALGAEVWPVNYEGDVGLHVAKALWGLKKLGFDPQRLKDECLGLDQRVKMLGQAYVEGDKAYEASTEAKKEMAAINSAIYKQDSSQAELLELWRVGRKISLDHFEKIYRRLGTTYRRYYFESEVAGAGRDLILAHLDDGVFTRSEGAVIFDGEKQGLHKRVFVTGEGYATYEAKDMYLAPLKYSEFPYDFSLILTGSEQAEYFKVVLTALSLVNPDLSSKTVNFPFGMVRLKDEKMSSRKGNVILAEELINEAKNVVRTIIKPEGLSTEAKEEISETVAVAAVKYSLLKVDAKKDLAFNLKESVALEGNSGPYLQYTYARARSVLRKSKGLGLKVIRSKGLKPALDLSALRTKDLGSEEQALLRTLYRFPEVVESAALNYSPHLLCNFLFDLAQKFNLFYNNVKILDENKVTNSSFAIPNSSLRLTLTAATAQIIKNGLYLLGIEAPELM